MYDDSMINQTMGEKRKCQKYLMKLSLSNNLQE